VRAKRRQRLLGSKTSGQPTGRRWEKAIGELHNSNQNFENHMEALKGDTYNITLPELCPVTIAS